MDDHPPLSQAKPSHANLIKDVVRSLVGKLAHKTALLEKVCLDHAAGQQKVVIKVQLGKLSKTGTTVA